MNPLSLLAAGSIVLSPSPENAAPRVGEVAPAHGIESWEGADAAATKQRVRSDEQSRTGKPLVELEFALLENVRGVRGSSDNLRLLRLHRALVRGFPKSRALEECSGRIEERRRKLGAGSFLDATTWIELEEKRPVLFPRRKDAAGKRFAGKIAKLIRNVDDTQLTRLIRGMLAEFESL